MGLSGKGGGVNDKKLNFNPTPTLCYSPTNSLSTKKQRKTLL
jgi:hypothetical protein